MREDAKESLHIEACREKLLKLINNVKYAICYIKKDAELMHAIEEYCKNLPVASSVNLHEKTYWLLHGLKDYPLCQCKGCSNRVRFASLKAGYNTACCNSHAQLVAWPKTAATNLKKFGAKTPLQSKEIRKAINQHNLETYGTTNVVESEYFKKKRIETCRKNFGVDYPMQSEEVKAKSRASCKETYGVEYVLQDEGVRTKRIETSLKHYGVTNPAQNEEVKAKTKATLQKNYGVDAPAQCPEIRRKQQTKYFYNGKYFDSKFELAYSIWLEDHNIEFTYEPDLSFKYVYNDTTHVYFPDFIVEGQVIEIKGDYFFNENGTMCNPWDHSQDGLYEAKHQCMLKNNVKIIKTSSMKDIIAYVAETYGKRIFKDAKQ